MIGFILTVLFGLLCPSLADHVEFSAKDYHGHKDIVMNCTVKRNASEHWVELNITKDGHRFYSYDANNQTVFVMTPGIIISKSLAPGAFVIANANKSASGHYKCRYTYWIGDPTHKSFHHSSKTYNLNIKKASSSKGPTPGQSKAKAKKNGTTLHIPSWLAIALVMLNMLSFARIFLSEGKK